MKQHDLLDRYLNKDLSDEQMDRLEKDANFQAYLQKWQAIERAINPHSSLNQFRQITQEVVKKTPKRIGYKKYRAIAAIGILVIALAAWLFWPKPSLFDQHYEHLHKVAVKRTNGSLSEQSVQLKQLDQLYQNQSYNAALNLLDQLQQEALIPKNTTYYFKKAELHLLCHQPQQALEALTQVQQAYKEHIPWLSAWAYYQLEDTEQFTQTLQTLAQEKGIYQEKALLILEQIPQ